MWKKIIPGLVRKFQDIAFGITGRWFKIIRLGRESNELAYTRGDKDEISVNFEHPIMDKMTDEEKSVFTQGLEAHELLHQVNTDFKGFYKMAEEIGKKEGDFQASIFRDIVNVMDDPSIENHAPKYMGGFLLRALHFMIAVCYRESPEINPKDPPLVQFMTAAIHYGDGGFIKGTIADEKAREIFAKVLPIFDKAIETFSGKKRIKYYREVYELTRPLWEEELEKKELMERMAEVMKSSGKSDSKESSAGKSSGCPDIDDADFDEDSEGASDEISEKKKARRKKAAKDVSRSLPKSSEDGDSEDSASGSGDSDDGTPEDGDSEDGTSGDGSGEGKDSKKDAEGKKSGSKGDEKSEDPDGEGEGKGEDGKGTDEDGDKEKEGSEESGSGSGKEKDAESGEEGEGSETGSGGKDSEKSGEKDSSSESGPPGGKGIYDHEPDEEDEGDVLPIEEEEYTLTPEEIERVMGELKELEDEAVIEELQLDIDEGIIDVPALSSEYPGLSCLNLAMKGDFSEYKSRYNSIVASMQEGINSLVDRFERMFRDAREEKLYRQSGRISIKRLTSGRMTARVFTRRVNPTKSDLAVLLLVDVSGSMNGNRMKMATKATIGLAEVFAALKIPFKVIAFTGELNVKEAGGAYYDILHRHFVNWTDDDEARLSLMALKAECQNNDGYSIRYAANVLKARPEEHKMLIVISDGQPACSYYSRRRNGIVDTTDAIREARKDCAVFGAAIGADRNILYNMYGNGFVDITEISQLFEQLGDVIKEEVDSW